MLHGIKWAKGRWCCVLLFILLANWPCQCVAAEDLESLADSVRDSINKGIVFFHSISQQGGYVYYVTPDLTEYWGCLLYTSPSPRD